MTSSGMVGLTPCLVGALLGALLLVGCRPGSAPALEPRPIDLTSLEPGARTELNVGTRRVELSIPAGEGMSVGSFHLEIPSLGFASGPLERDGSLESVWIADVNGDGAEDGVFVIRNAGSGSYVEIVVLESDGRGFAVRTLPSVSSATVPGYPGHDDVTIGAGSIIRSFPTYTHRRRLRIDRQWRPASGLRGEPPVKVKSDSNADPSGATVELRYDYTAGRWKRT